MKRPAPKWFMLIGISALAGGLSPRIAAADPMGKKEWCDKVDQFKDGPDWACTWPPGRYAPGDFGPSNNPGRYNIIGGVFDDADTSAAKKVVVRKAGTIELGVSKTTQVGVQAGLDLRSLSAWMPEVTLSVSQDTSVQIAFRLEDAEWRLFQNLPPAIADGLTDPSKEVRAQNRIKRAKEVLCKKDGALVEGVLVGKITAIIKLASGGSGGTKLGWAKAGLNVVASRTSATEIAVKGNGDPIALMYLVSNSHDVLKDFELCTPPK